jgi:hypothetical protein
MLANDRENYEKFYEMNGMSREELLNDAKLISGYDPHNTLTNVIDKTNAAFDNLTSSSAYQTMLSNYSNLGTSCISSITEGIDGNISAITTPIMDAMTECITSIRNTYGEWFNAGMYVAEGFARGIVRNAVLAVLAAKQLVADAIDAAKAQAGINSPSKVFAGIGAYCVMGLANGFIDNANIAKGAASELSDSVIGAFQSTIQQISEVVNSDIDTQPTIRPVLDLSDVKSGTATLNAMFSRSQAIKASAGMSNNVPTEIQNGDNVPKTGNSYQFVQNNYSPKALSRTEIYRQTRNQFTAMKGVLG